MQDILSRRTLWRTALLLVAGILVWRITVLGLSEHFAARARYGDSGAAARALNWKSDNPEALTLYAARLLEHEPGLAGTLLERALRANPADSRAAVMLSRLREAAGRGDEADRLMELVAELSPADNAIREALAAWWVERERLDRAVANWSAAMIADPAARKDLFPVFLSIAENPELRPALRTLADDPPPWWDAFFAFAARRAVQTASLQALYDMRRKSGTPLTAGERSHYVQRLRRDGRWPLAYYSWLSGLDPAQRRVLGQLYNGGFEQEFTSAGFDWHLRPLKGIRVRRDQTYGASGERALHLVFQGKKVRFRHLHQPLYLAPGGYRLRGRARVDSLQSRGGLQWTLACAGDERVVLGRSERFLGTSEWRTFTFEFTVPPGDDCQGQTLRLESTGTRSVDHRIQGAIWFDDMAIRALPPPGPQPETPP